MDASFGVKLVGLVPDYVPTFRELPGLVAQLEEIGFDDVMDGEHVLFGPGMDHPGGSGNFEHSRREQQSDRADTLITFSAIAARTTRIKMFSGILLGAIHSFPILARQASTLDVISGGRFVLGIGPGWNAAEFAASGIPPEERAARVEEIVRACRELWSPGLSTFEGRWISFRDVISEPGPYTPGGPPVWWGGDARKRPTARRVVTLGEGWVSSEAADHDQIAASIENLRATCERYGRDPSTLGFRASITATADWDTARSADEITERAIANGRRLIRAGVTHFNIPLSYYRINLDELSTMLKALRAA